MEIKASSCYLRISPTKSQEVIRVIRGRRVAEAIELLRFIPRKATHILAKTLQSAMANAENNHNLDSDKLFVTTAVVEQGPAFKRFRPVARGSVHPYKKRTSHIRVLLSEEESEPSKKLKEST